MDRTRAVAVGEFPLVGPTFDRLRDAVLRAGSGLVAAYRRTGADVPFGDPVPSHGTEMEGWFWRVTDPASGRVVVALCGVNRHPAGDWATVAVALHPGGIVRSAALDDAQADRAHFALRAGTSAQARIEAIRTDSEGRAIGTQPFAAA